MNAPSLKTTLLTLALLVLAHPDSSVLAQSTNKGPAVKKSGIPGQEIPQGARKAGPFRGKLAALDKAAKTITVGKRTFQVTPQTKINKSGKPSTLNEAVVGEPVSGYVKPAEGGKWVATTLNLGPKSETKTDAAKSR
jgi:hypothetical protein